MTQKPKPLTLTQILSEIQIKFKAKKSRYNSFGKYYFRSAEDILEGIKPLLEEYGIYVIIEEELIYSHDIPMLVSKAIITDGVERIAATAIVGVDLNQKGMQVPQQFGSASSYGKKYALGNLLLIDDTQDADASNNHNQVKEKLSGVALEKAKEYIKNGGSIDAIKLKYDVSPAIEKALESIK